VKTYRVHRAGTRNLVIAFDEFDKVHDPQVYHWFNQLFDDSSVVFMDQYISGLPVDISQVTFVCLTNSVEMLPGPLMNRFKGRHIWVQAPNNEKKMAIAQKHSIPEILKDLNFNEKDIVFPDDTLDFIMDKLCISNDEGMRQLINAIETIVEKVNTIRAQRGTNVFQTTWHFNVKFPLTVTKQLVTSLLS
jgi:ATP-dependent Lon protease